MSSVLLVALFCPLTSTPLVKAEAFLSREIPTVAVRPLLEELEDLLGFEEGGLQTMGSSQLMGMVLEAAEEVEEDIFSDEEDEDEETMDAFKYLDFSRDEAFVSKLVDDVLDFNVGTHALMLLKFNFQKEKNLQLVADKFSQKLFNNAVERLNLQYSTLPASICASHLIKNLVEQAELSVTAEQVNNMVSAAERLCAENEGSRTIVPTASEEASFLLLETVPQATEKVSDVGELDIQDNLNRITKKTSFDQVRDSAEALIESN